MPRWLEVIHRRDQIIATVPNPNQNLERKILMSLLQETKAYQGVSKTKTLKRDREKSVDVASVENL